MILTKAPTEIVRENQFVVYVDCFDVNTSRLNRVLFGVYDPISQKTELETEYLHLWMITEAYMSGRISCIRTACEALGTYMSIPNERNKVLAFFHSKYYGPRSVRIEYHNKCKRSHMWVDMSSIEWQCMTNFEEYLDSIKQQ